MMPASLAQLERCTEHVVRFSPGQAGRDTVEAFIATVFAHHYGARITRFMPDLFALMQDDGPIEATAGCRPANVPPLFLEQYLDEPVEKAISRIAGHPVPREGIVEVGQLAANRPGAGTMLMLHLARHLATRGYGWIIFTATEELRGIFVRLGLPLFALSHADASRLGEEARNWGSYYEHSPLVVCASVSEAMRRLANGKVLRRMGYS